MAKKTKQQLKSMLVDGHLLTGQDCTDLVDSLKGVQEPVSMPASSGHDTVFVSSVTQDAEGKIVVESKTVDFSPYQSKAEMKGYQQNDLQVIGEVLVDGSELDIDTVVTHKKGHLPTVRLIDAFSGMELRPADKVLSPYTVVHTDAMELTITLNGALNVKDARYLYILD